MDDESNPKFWYNPADYYNKVAQGDELRHLKHLRDVGPDTPDFRVQLKVQYPEGEMTIKHEFLNGQDLSEHMDNKCIEPLLPLVRQTEPVPFMKKIAMDMSKGK